MFIDDEDQILWEDEWTNDPYIGLPRAVRLTVDGGVFGEDEQTLELLIPHGVLLQTNA